MPKYYGVSTMDKISHLVSKKSIDGLNTIDSPF